MHRDRVKSKGYCKCQMSSVGRFSSRAGPTGRTGAEGGSMIVPLVFHRVDSFPFLGVYISGVVYISWSGRPEGVQFGGRFVHPVDKKVESVGYETWRSVKRKIQISHSLFERSQLRFRWVSACCYPSFLIRQPLQNLPDLVTFVKTNRNSPRAAGAAKCGQPSPLFSRTSRI